MSGPCGAGWESDLQAKSQAQGASVYMALILSNVNLSLKRLFYRLVHAFFFYFKLNLHNIHVYEQNSELLLLYFIADNKLTF